MAAVALEGEASTPISLYVELAQERRGDLEVISRAALAWAETIREAAFLADPFLDVRVELISGTEGSLDLNSRIRKLAGSIKDTVSDRKKLKTVAIAVALFFAKDVFDWARGKAWDAAWDWVQAEYSDLVQDFTDDDKKAAEDLATKVAASKVAQAKIRQVYLELKKDDGVTGVGVSFVPGKRPADVVPRSEFEARSGAPSVTEETIKRRTEQERYTLTLVSPALSDSDYKWKFQLGTNTIWAFMDDEAFKNRLKPGSNSAPRMLTGILMVVDLETVQEFREGVWQTVEQRVKKVHRLDEPLQQSEWLDAPSEPEQP